MTFLFKLNDPHLLRILAHTTAHKDECTKAYCPDEKEPDTVFLVKDDGAYLMTCTVPRLMNEAARGNDPKCVVAYADGARPEDGHIGGDDFAENLPAQWFRDAIAKKKPHIIITITADEIKATT